MKYNGAVLEADTQCGVLRAMDTATAALEFPGISLPNRAEQRPHAIAIRLRTTSLTTLRSILEHNQVPHREVPGRVFVEPQAAGNVILEFVQNT